MRIEQAIELELVKRRMKKKDLAAAMETHPANLSRAFTGERDMRTSEVRAAAHVLGMTIRDLAAVAEVDEAVGGMSQLCYTLPQIAGMTGFSEQRIRRAITGLWVSKKKTGEPLPRLRAKKGASGSYIVLHDDLAQWLDSLPEVTR